jgi:hypothetical protein
VNALLNEFLPPTAARLPHIDLVRKHLAVTAASSVGPFQVQKVHLCPKGCMAFRDSPGAINPILHNIQHATACPFCKTPRYRDAALTQPRAVSQGPSRARVTIVWQFFYLFPLVPQLRALFARADTSEHMSWRHHPTDLTGVYRARCDTRARDTRARSVRCFYRVASILRCDV